MRGAFHGGRRSRRSLLAGMSGAALALAGGSSTAARQAVADYWPTHRWRVADPDEQGVDPFTLDAVDARGPDEVPALSALLAARHGYIVFDRYYGRQDPERPINVRSVTKSVTGTLAGAALRTGLLRGLDETVGEAIPERIPEDADPRVFDITLWQWLTMTSGLQW